MAGRTQARRFSSETIKTDVRSGLVLTGVSAAHRLTPGRSSIRRVVMGYIREDRLEDHARGVEWTPDHAGVHVLFALNLPIPYNDLRMPKAVIAADLTHSTDEADREMAITVMDRIRTDWLRRHSAAIH